MSLKKRGLGRGLDALLTASKPAHTAPAVSVSELQILPVEFLRPGKYQPRKDMSQEALEDLASSIRAQGIIQPIVVRPLAQDKFEIIAGERRWRASQLAQLSEVPCIVKDVPDEAAVAIALIENIHRSQLNPLEEGAAYQQLLNDFSYTHDELAVKLSKSRPAITNTMRLLNLPPSVQRKVAAGVISAGHARALLSLTDEKEIENLANRIVAEGLTVRAVEEIVSTGGAKVKAGSIRSGKIIAPKLKEISDQLSDHLDTRVSVELGKQKGKIVIEFATVEDLERINSKILKKS